MPATKTPPSNTPAAMGDPSVQLKHLKAHLAFQSHPTATTAVISRIPSITRAQSRRHITTHLHQKINSKHPGFYQPGTLNSPEGQQELLQFARRLQRRERLCRADGPSIHWNLRKRAIHAHYPQPDLDSLIALMAERHHEALLPKHNTFPRRVRVHLERTDFLRQLLAEQGLSPRRHRRYTLALTLACERCSTHFSVEDLTNPQVPPCPCCSNPLLNAWPAYRAAPLPRPPDT